jgi:hypothetical protein
LPRIVLVWLPLTARRIKVISQFAFDLHSPALGNIEHGCGQLLMTSPLPAWLPVVIFDALSDAM